MKPELPTSNPERVYSLREIKKVLSRPEIFRFMSDELNPETYVPNPNDIYFRLGKGLIVYEPKGVCAEMHAALLPGDVGKGALTTVKGQWEYLRQMGFSKVYTIHDNDHQRASVMCRALGMRRIPNSKFKIYEIDLNG